MTCQKKRKIHTKPIPLIGGIIILLNIIFFYALFFSLDSGVLLSFEGERSLINLILIGTLICFFGVYDDKYGISPTNKILILTLLMYVSLIIDPSLIIKSLNFNNTFFINIEQFSIFFTILCFLIFLNTFNMFDGLNGQSGFYSIVILIFFLIKNSNLFSIYLLIPLAFFLYLNLRNKTFLGDNGSYLLSYILSCLIIKTYNHTGTVMTVEEIFLILFYPGLDLIRLFFSRTTKGKHPFYPDDNHIHHIILKKTRSQKKVLLINIFSIILPILLYLIIGNIYFALSTVTLLYFINIIYFGKIKNV